MEKVLKRPDGLLSEYPLKGGAAPTATHYCPGCGHGVLHKLIGEAMSDLAIKDRMVLISPVGCAVFAYYYFDCGHVQTAHGRAPAVATGMTRVRKDAILVSYQGDGDLASIGLNETMQAANRGERMAVFFVNNTVYGMTGGQMAPTTLVGERTSTSPQGRDPLQAGYPLHMCELIDQLEAPVFIERVSVSDIRHIRKARKAVRKALEIQRDKKGYAFVEILSPCPTNFKQDIAAGIAFVNEQMEKEFPLGNYRDRSETAEGLELPDSDFSIASLEHLLLEDGHGGPEAREDSSFPTLEIKIAGFGGQGVLSMGLMLTRAGCREGRFVSWLPSYGPEQRGGTSNCSVVIAGQAIGAPVVNHPDVLVAMNRPSLQRFADSVKPDGLVLFDRTIDDFELPGHVRSVAVLAMQIAGEAGSEKAANTVMLGVLMAMEALPLPEEAFRYGLQQHFSARPDRLDMNIRVFDHAREWASEHL